MATVLVRKFWIRFRHVAALQVHVSQGLAAGQARAELQAARAELQAAGLVQADVGQLQLHEVLVVHQAAQHGDHLHGQHAGAAHVQEAQAAGLGHAEAHVGARCLGVSRLLDGVAERVVGHVQVRDRAVGVPQRVEQAGPHAGPDAVAGHVQRGERGEDLHPLLGVAPRVFALLDLSQHDLQELPRLDPEHQLQLVGHQHTARVAQRVDERSCARTSGAARCRPPASTRAADSSSVKLWLRLPFLCTASPPVTASSGDRHAVLPPVVVTCR
jgi:hypothetical protein